MTDNIVSLDDYRPHQSTYVACIDCGKDWVAVAPAETEAFECPKCRALSGKRVEPTSVDFINEFMRPAKTKKDRDHRAMVLINAGRMKE